MELREERRGSKAKFMPCLQNNTDSVVLILQLSPEVVETEHPGLSDFNIHHFSVTPGSLVPKGQMETLLKIGSVHSTVLMYFILTLPQSNGIREAI